MFGGGSGARSPGLSLRLRARCAAAPAAAERPLARARSSRAMTTSRTCRTQATPTRLRRWCSFARRTAAVARSASSMIGECTVPCVTRRARMAPSCRRLQAVAAPRGLQRVPRHSCALSHLTVPDGVGRQSGIYLRVLLLDCSELPSRGPPDVLVVSDCQNVPLPPTGMGRVSSRTAITASRSQYLQRSLRSSPRLARPVVGGRRRCVRRSTRLPEVDRRGRPRASGNHAEDRGLV